MASDGQRSHCGTITNREAAKVRRLSDGSIVGTSGDVAFGGTFIEWLENGGERPKLEGDGGFASLILKPCGELLLSGQDCKPVPIASPFAIGSGMDLAIGAMEAGASAEEAVAIAARRDPNTGGTITVLERTIRNLKAEPRP